MNCQDITFYNRKERPWLGRLDYAAIVGHTTASSSRIWVRMKSEGIYHLVVSESPLTGVDKLIPVNQGDSWSLPVPDGSIIPIHAAHELTLKGETDFTGVAEVGELRPDRQYYYGVVNIERKQWYLGNEREHLFRTLPEDRKGAWDVTFGVYSCHMPFDPSSTSKADASMWSLLRNELQYAGARFVIGGGDQVYADGTDYLNIWKWLKKVKKCNPTSDDMVSWYRDIYRGYWNFPDVQAVYSCFPNYMIWDDHEIMDGWGSYTEKELSQKLDTLFDFEDVGENVRLAEAMFGAAKKVYHEYQHSHNPVTPRGVYDYTFAHCSADFFVFDMRGERNFGKDEYAILGKDQHARLESWINKLDSKRDGPIFVVSTVPVVHLKDFVSDTLDWLAVFGARDDVRDHWAHDKHGKEISLLLERLFFCAHETERPLVILSGDVHIGGVFRLFREDGVYPKAKVYQVTSSAISYAALGQAKMALLAKAVARRGTVGDTAYHFRNHVIFPQHNFALVRYRTNGQQTLSIDVDFVGKSEDGRVQESKRVDLLCLD